MRVTIEAGKKQPNTKNVSIGGCKKETNEEPENKLDVHKRAKRRLYGYLQIQMLKPNKKR